MKKCCMCERKHNTYIDYIPVCLECFKFINKNRFYISVMLKKLNGA